MGRMDMYLKGLSSLDKECVAHATVLIFCAYIIGIGPTPMLVLPPWGVWNCKAVALVPVGHSNVTTVSRVDTDNSNHVCLALSEVSLFVLPMILMPHAVAGPENRMRTVCRKEGAATVVHDRICIIVGLWEAVIQEFEIPLPF